MPKKMTRTRNLLLMATLLGSALFARASDKEMTIGAIYLDTQGYYAGVRQGVQDAAKDSSVQVQLIETNAQGDISKESTFVDTLVARNVDAIILSAVSENGSSRTVRRASEAGIPVICYNTCINQKGVDKYVSAYLVGDPLEFGKKLGNAAADYFIANKIDQPKIAVINCEAFEVCVQRRKGFEEVLKARVPGAQIVANQEGTVLDKAISVGEKLIISTPDLNAIMGESGGATLGAVKAVRNQNQAGKIAVFGSDMTTEIAQELENNQVLKAVAGNKRYPGVVALDNVNFTLNKGEVRALLGKNGAGKSTLIRMLTGSERPDSGDIWIGETRLEGDEATLTLRAAELGVRAVYQELSLVEGLTVAENLCLGQWPRRNGMIDYLQMAQDAQRCLQALGVDVSPEQLVSTLSPAQKQLVEIARVMKGEPRVVILDEPTSSLASVEVELVISAVKKMSALGVAVIYVSHRMEEIRRIASCATVMRDGQVAGDVMLENTSTHHIVSLMLGRDHVDIAPVAPQEIVDQAVLEVRALRHKPKLEDISFTLRRGEVLGIAGLLGAGRSELLKAIVGLETYEQGEIVINGEKITRPDYGDMLKRGIGYTPENRKEAGIIPWLGVDENTVLTNRQKISANGVLQWSTIRRLTEEVMQRMTVKAASSETPIGTLSGGNQQKVVIGRWVYAASQILLLDEPTRGVDIEAKQQIYRIVRELAAEGKSVVFISSEVEELPLVCDRILLLQHGTFSQEFHSPVNVDELMSAILSVH